MPWLEQVPAVLESWYSGQEQGNALADVLFGDVNPSGKLPITFPRSESDTPVLRSLEENEHGDECDEAAEPMMTGVQTSEENEA